MSHKVFISHSSADRDIANAICHYLEADGIRCWLAPRDIDSSDWAGSIMRGLQSCDVFVVIISHNSIPSGEVTKEVTEATRVCQYILPFKVDEEMLNDRLRYHLAPCHWLDAITRPLEQHIERLKERIKNLSNEDAIYANQNRRKLVGTSVMPKSFFMGRDDEIRQIHEILTEEHVLFLQGMGGIGKSEIAKGYAKTYAADYDTVLFANYRDSILEMIIGDDIEIENFKRNTAYGQDAESNEAFFKRKLQALKELADHRTLLIVDNFDVDYDEHLEDLVNGPYRLLFTTRYEHYDYPALPVGPIQNFDTVRALFVKNYGRALPPKEKDTIDEILKLVSCHTITVELIAKQMRASFTPPAKMLEMLRSGGMNAGFKEGVKRGGSGKSAFDFIKDLFHLSALSEDEQYIMKCMCLIPFSGIDVNRLGQYLELESFDIINDLIAKSWLMLDDETYYLKMHPIICDVVKDQLHPTTNDCSQYVIGLWKDFRDAWHQTLEERAEKWPLVDHIVRHYGTPTLELWQQYADFCNICWICSQFPQAIAMSKAFYDFTVKEFGDAGYHSAFAARAIAGSYYNAGDEKSAEPYYYIALEHMLKKPEESYKELALIHEKVGRCCYLNGDFEKSADYLTKAMHYHEIAASIPAENCRPVTKNDVYVELARMNMAMGNYEKALEYCQQSYDLILSYWGHESTSSAYSLNDMGICYSELGDFEKANEYLRRALELNIQFNGEASMTTVRVRESIADNLAKQGKIEEAKAAYLALELEMEKNFGSECPQVLRLREKGEGL